ncbi:type VII secretion protein EccB [Mycobacterium alsense]|uniref:Type VII secretion protein EccB n=1 Tax=Mycobacterium alsense TaxID=324058 RepID=A0AA41XL29_9MYCO|nr:type VII secretion protein EccB [Mycobacterium alsense]MCV7377362.1 type VII secretion protein EccB [Mycobacterium alsense]OQZ89688.1 type VII secretion protein EccB [Mycobacterium alsense]
MAEESRGQRGSGYGLGLSTRTQVTGYQFLARRTAMALTRWRVRMEIEPGRRQTLAVVASVSAALVICLGALLWSFLSPSGQINESPIIADRDSGALYVRVGDKLYPALNLASARLITGRPDNPHLVRSSQIANLPRGPLVGIPGAPSNFAPKTPTASSWLVCDTVGSTGVGAPSGVTVTVIDGTPDLSGHRQVLNGSDAVVLRYGDDAWVVRQGRRSKIDAMNRSVLLPLGLTPEQVSMAKPMSRALYDALPVGPELVVPEIPNAGSPAAFPGAPGPVGTVIVTPQISGPQQYSLVLTDGVQTLPPLVAQILQNAGGPGSSTKPVTVEPSALAKMPVVNKLDLSSYPDNPLNVMDIRENPATCWWWQKTSGENRARIQVVSGSTLPIAAKDLSKVVSLVKADTTGREADQVYFAPDHANFVAVTGNDAGAKTTESLWWLTDAGARFGVDDTREAREALGLKTTPSLAPWVALRLLPQGPTLSRADALVQHDTLPMDMSPAELVVPR